MPVEKDIKWWQAVLVITLWIGFIYCKVYYKTYNPNKWQVLKIKEGKYEGWIIQGRD